MKTKFKYENVIFILLVIAYVIGAFYRECSLTINLTTLATQLIMCVGIRSMLKYVRKNSIEIKKSISEMLTF